jgi:Na+/phosphate symporter
MGTSLADRAWGSESAVYRVTGVISVIGGWFFTAFSAFVSAFIMAMLFSYFGITAVGIAVLLVVFVIYRTHFLHKKRIEERELDGDEISDETLTNNKMITKASKSVIKNLRKIGNSLNDAILYFGKGDLRRLKTTFYDYKKINVNTKALKDNVSKAIDKLEETDVESGHYYVQVVGFLREIAQSTFFIIQPTMKHLDNSHKTLLYVQIDELNSIQIRINDFIEDVIDSLKSHDFSNVDEIIVNQRETLKLIKSIRKNQVKRIKDNEIGTRNSMLIFNLLEEYKSIVFHMVSLLKSQRNFINFVNGESEPDDDSMEI